MMHILHILRLYARKSRTDDDCGSRTSVALAQSAHLFTGAFLLSIQQVMFEC
jgi:hypothetical protein